MRLRTACLVALVGVVPLVGCGGRATGATAPTTQCAPAVGYPAATTAVAFWSTEARCAVVPAGPGGVLRLRVESEQTPHAVCVAESVLGRLHRPLRPPLLDGHLD